MHINSVNIFVSALSDEEPGSLTTQRITGGFTRFVWKVGQRITLEEALQIGRHDDDWRLRATTRAGYVHGNLKTEAFGVYQHTTRSAEQAWSTSLSMAYHVAEQWEISGAYDYARIPEQTLGLSPNALL
ncbi:MAG: hypothetical protein HY981_00305 [Candidatus Magasanikbacteria bacterium]|nr:hypothetical protein [Candidatus Magasanikbacteria bacterium]